MKGAFFRKLLLGGKQSLLSGSCDLWVAFRNISTNYNFIGFVFVCPGTFHKGCSWTVKGTPQTICKKDIARTPTRSSTWNCGIMVQDRIPLEVLSRTFPTSKGVNNNRPWGFHQEHFISTPVHGIFKDSNDSMSYKINVEHCSHKLSSSLTINSLSAY